MGILPTRAIGLGSVLQPMDGSGGTWAPSPPGRLPAESCRRRAACRLHLPQTMTTAPPGDRSATICSEGLCRPHESQSICSSPVGRRCLPPGRPHPSHTGPGRTPIRPPARPACHRGRINVASTFVPRPVRHAHGTGKVCRPPAPAAVGGPCPKRERRDRRARSGRPGPGVTRVVPRLRCPSDNELFTIIGHAPSTMNLPPLAGSTAVPG